VARTDYEMLLLDLDRHVAHGALIDFGPLVEVRAGRKAAGPGAEQIERLASRLGKARVDVVAANRPASAPRKWAPFWSAFAHIIRNTVGSRRGDHRHCSLAGNRCRRAVSASPRRPSVGGLHAVIHGVAV